MSLLDRLFDSDPESGTDNDHPRPLRAIHADLRRDLEALLNTRRPHAAWVEQVEKSAAAFGLPDVTTEDFHAASTKKNVMDMIEQAIKFFEPRLSRVELHYDAAVAASALSFRIDAVLRVEGAEEAVAYNGRLRPTDRSIRIDTA